MKKLSYRVIFGLIVSITLVAFFLTQIDYESLILTMQKVNLFYYFIACLVFIIGYVISAVRWQILLKAYNINASIYKLFLIYFGTSFYNFFSPSTIGGDIARIYHSSKIDKNRTNIISSIVMDRFTGLIALFSITFILSLFNLQFFNNEILLLNFLILICLFITIFMIFNANAFGIFFSFFSIFKGFTIIENKLREIHSSIISYKKHRKIVFGAILYSYVFHLVSSFTLYFLILSIGIKIPISFIIFSFFFIQLVTLLPISISGIGVREVAYLFLFSKVGVSTSEIAVLLIAGYSLKIFTTILSWLVGLSLIESRNRELER